MAWAWELGLTANRYERTFQNAKVPQKRIVMAAQLIFLLNIKVVTKPYLKWVNFMVRKLNLNF